MKTRTCLLLLLCISSSYLLAQNTTIKPDKACINCPTDSPETGATVEIRGNTKIEGKLDLQTASSVSLVIGASAGETGSGIFNTFVGQSAGEENTSSFNTYIGLEAGQYGTGGFNTFVGRQAGRTNTGSENTYMGNDVNRELDSGSRNTLIGESAAGFGNNNSVFGKSAIAGEITFNEQTFEDEVSIMVNNAAAIGYRASVVADNKMRFGNGSISVIEGQVNWSFPSDARFKNNIKEDIKGLDFIMNLRPVTYHFDVNKYNDFFGISPTKDAEELASIEAASKILHSGFIAQEVEKAAEDLDYDFSGLVKPQNDKDNYGLRYGSFVVPLVKAVQEQQVQMKEKDKLIEEQTEKMEGLAAKNEEFEVRLAKIEALLSGKAEEISTINSTITSATLKQNAPNPFDESTTIQYFIPAQVTSASLQVMDQNGRIIKSIPIQDTGNGQITLQANLLSTGTYSYSLVLDGQVMDTKQMVLTH